MGWSWLANGGECWRSTLSCTFERFSLRSYPSTYSIIQSSTMVRFVTTLAVRPSWRTRSWIAKNPRFGGVHDFPFLGPLSYILRSPGSLFAWSFSVIYPTSRVPTCRRSPAFHPMQCLLVSSFLWLFDILSFADFLGLLFLRRLRPTHCLR